MVVITPIAEEDRGGPRQRFRKYVKSSCSLETVKNRLPIIKWVPQYRLHTLSQDFIAGLTVGLTAIPQGIAYAVVAGLSPEYGLYAALMGGFVYMVFGGTKAITIGPTAIMSVMVTDYVVNYSSDFAVLASFLAGVVIFLMAVFNLGFLVTFVSAPVIIGFTVAGALQIASGQFRNLFGMSGSSGSTFAESMYHFFRNITTVTLYESLLSFGTIGVLVALKYVGQGCKRTDSIGKQIRWFIALSRNAIVVIIGMLIAYTIKITMDGEEPLSLIGDIGHGIPAFTLPPFSTLTHDGEYLNFWQMLNILGPQFIVIPLVSIIDTIAIAKAFSDGELVEAKQEMLALGLINMIGACVRSMPTTGSFTRSALNHASGVQTTFGGVFTGAIILLALSLMTPAFYYIPRATLAGVIVNAMFTMIEYDTFPRLWRTGKKELFVLTVTVLFSMFLGLEIGILAGIILDAVILVYFQSKPKMTLSSVKAEDGNYLLITLWDRVAYCAAEQVRKAVLKTTLMPDTNVIIDGSEMRKMDTTVAANMFITLIDLKKSSRKVILLNFKPSIKKMCLEIQPKFERNFVEAEGIEECLKLLNKMDEADTTVKIDTIEEKPTEVQEKSTETNVKSPEVDHEKV